jgi:hypothetical protein
MAKRKTSATVYLVYLSANESYALTDMTQETFMGTKCIRGSHGTPNTWHFTANRTIHIPCDRIHFIVEYDSRNAYINALKRHHLEKTM